jgi:hypothetical protein
VASVVRSNALNKGVKNMNVTQQKRFVRELISSIQDEILSKVYDMPSDWDGIELRQYIADQFASAVYPMKGARKRNYKNSISIVNL